MKAEELLALPAAVATGLLIVWLVGADVRDAWRRGTTEHGVARWLLGGVRQLGLGLLV